MQPLSRTIRSHNIEVETSDIETFTKFLYGPRLEYIWHGKEYPNQPSITPSPSMQDLRKTLSAPKNRLDPPLNTVGRIKGVAG
jgi:hypothetical protein